MNLVTDDGFEATEASASYQVGSFGTHRLTGAAQVVGESDLVARADGFFDAARNDYAIQVEVPDARGRLGAATVDRFHDGYLAAGGGLTVGAVRQP